MERSDVVARLTPHSAEIAGRGVTAVHLFGSTIRGVARSGSDVDLFLDPAPDATFSLVDLVDLGECMERWLGTKVDLTTRDALHPLLREGIERDAERIL